MRSERDGDRLDAAIDAAARSLTAGEPTALRASVRERISRRNNVRWLVPASAMAVLAAMFVGRALLGPPGGPDRARPTDVRVTSDSPSMQSVTQGVLVGRTLSGPAAPGGPDKARPTPGLAPTFEPPFEEPEPLIPPIVIAPLETELITVDSSSGVMPIEIEPLQIEPLRGD